CGWAGISATARGSGSTFRPLTSWGAPNAKSASASPAKWSRRLERFLDLEPRTRCLAQATQAGVRQGQGRDLGDLAVFQIDRRGAAEDRDGDLEAAGILVDGVDGAFEGRERAIGHFHLFAQLELHLRTRTLHGAGFDAAEDLVDFLLRHRQRLLAMLGSEEARHLGRVLVEVVCLVVQDRKSAYMG